MSAEKFVEYKSGSAFPGKIGRTVDESTPAWPTPLRAKAGAPNVLFIILDDVGYGQMGCFGGLCETPNFDKLATEGLRYTNMHTTGICSPSRSCILTGRNHHSNGMSSVTDVAIGFPGSNGIMPFENGMLSEILLQQGYNTFALGKWHLCPQTDASAAGPYDRWPIGRGFERYYGFLGGDTHQYYPDLVHDNHQIEPPKTPEEGYHLTEDLVDKAIEFIQDAHVVAPDKPFFMYFALGACHAPHHVPKEWADKYKGKFDMGWDKYREVVHKRQLEMGIIPPGTKLSPRDPDVPTWDSLSSDQKRLSARMMEVYAGFFTHADYHVGRLIHFLEELGELDNTLIIVQSDNGASAEGGATGSVNENLAFNSVPEDLKINLQMIDEIGGPNTYNHYPWGWAWAGDTPHRRWKRETYQGGVTDLCIVHWPKGFKAHGEIRSQYAHLIDFVPTVLDALGVEPPITIRGVVQSPIHGVSFAHTFDNPAAASKHVTQYYEMLGHRSVYHDGWKATCPWPGPSYTEAAARGRHFTDKLTAGILADLEAHGWELYHIAEDFSESHNVADQNSDKLKELIKIWWAEAEKYDVLPVASMDMARLSATRPSIAKPRSQYVYLPGIQSVPASVAANVRNRSHSITAEVEIPKGGAEGILIAHGALFGGYALYIKDRKLHYVHNYVGRAEYKVSSPSPVPEGAVTLRFEFEKKTEPDFKAGKGAGGTGQLYINGKLVAEAEIPTTTPGQYAVAGEGLTCGYDSGQGVTRDYKAPFRFTGQILRVTVDVSGELIPDPKARELAIKIIMKRQ